MPTATVTATLLGSTIILATLAQSAGAATVSTQVVAASGDPAPDGNGVFDNFNSAFGLPALSDNGQASFRAFLTGTSGGGLDDNGIFAGDGTTLTRISRAGDSAAGDGIFNNYNPNKSNDLGVVAFVGFLGGTSGGSGNDTGVYLSNGVTLTEVVREGDSAAGDGTFSGSFNTSPGINENGQVAFRAFLNGTSAGSANDTGKYFYSGGVLTELLREGDAAPDGDGVFGNLTSPSAINNSGQTAFFASLTGTSNTQGVFRFTGTTLEQIARVGQAAPDADGSFSSGFGGAALNNSGQVGFTASLTGTTADRGVFLGDDTSLTQIVRAGDDTPDLNGTFEFLGGPAINDAGQAVFSGFLTGTTEGSDDDSGIFRGSGGAITQIMREGQPAVGNGEFGGLISFALNGSGQVAFITGLTDTTGGTADDQGIFLFDDGLGLVEVVRKGDAMLGSTITELFFNGGIIFDDDEISGLNGQGQVAYRFTLADGHSGIAIATLPNTLQGDLNGDGFVGIDDLNIVLGNWNQNVPPGDPLADPSGDGFVGIDDLNEVLGNWNAGTPPAAAAVPEPATLSLILLGLGVGIRRNA